MSDYARIINDTLKRKETGYRYPGEILERCIINTPEHANEVLDGFLKFVEDRSGLNALRNDENAFNSNQIDMFVERVGNYKAALLKFLLTDEIVSVRPDWLNSVEDYVLFGEYIEPVAQSRGADDVLCGELIKEFSKVIQLLQQTLYDGKLLCPIVYYIKRFGLDGRYQKEEKRYLNLIRKAVDNVLSDADVAKLQEYGYSLLSVRKLNAINIGSYVAGRKDKAWYLFLKEAFFGAEVLSEENKRIISAKIEEESISSDGIKKIWKLERAINECKSMQDSLSYSRFDETSVNASFCLSFMTRYDHYGMASEISLTGELFNSFTVSQKNIIYKQYMNYSCDREEIRYCKDRLLECDPTGKYLSELPADRIIELVTKEVLSVDELDNTNVNMEFIVKKAFARASRTSLDILKKYADNAPDIFSDMHLSYNRLEKPVALYLIKGGDLSEDASKELYTVKERYFYRYAPLLYVEFILSVIRETKTLIHSKEEWLSLLDYLEQDGSDHMHIRRELLTEAEAAECLRERMEKQRDKTRLSLMEQVKKATRAWDIEWYNIPEDMTDVKHAVYVRFLELNDYSQKAENIVNECYYKDVITDEEFLSFYQRKKESLRKKEDA